MSGLILVSDSARCDSLVAFHEMFGKLNLVASCALKLLLLRNEDSSFKVLLAVAAGEAVFRAEGPHLLHIFICHK